MDEVGNGGSGLLNKSFHGSREVVRFGATERAFHWAFALPFLGLLLSGLPLSFAVLRSWINGYSPEIGLRLHLVCGVAWIVAPALVLAVGDRRALARAASDLFALVKDELLWLPQLPRLLAGLPCVMGGVGRFNAGQKLNALFVAMASLLLIITGALLWMAWQSPGFASIGEPARRAIIGCTRWLHYLLTLLILAPLFGHVILATVHPRTKESLRGMLFGVVDADWARAHHPKWYAEVYRKPFGQGESMSNRSQTSDLRPTASDR